MSLHLFNREGYRRLEKILKELRSDLHGNEFYGQLEGLRVFNEGSYKLCSLNGATARTRNKFLDGDLSSYHIEIDREDFARDHTKELKNSIIHEIAHVLDASYNGKKTYKHDAGWFDLALRLGLESPLAYYSCNKCKMEGRVSSFKELLSKFGAVPLAYPLPIDRDKTKKVHRCFSNGGSAILLLADLDGIEANGIKFDVPAYSSAVSKEEVPLFVYRRGKPANSD